MNKQPFFMLCILTAIAISQTATGSVKDGPKPYRYSYDIDTNGKIIERSVCIEYGGADWKACRRYAQWHLSQQCWGKRHQMRRTSGEAEKQVRKEMTFYCDAKSRVTPLN